MYYGIQREVRRKIKEAKNAWMKSKCEESEILERKQDSFNIMKKSHTYPELT